MDIRSMLGRYLNPTSNDPSHQPERDFDQICEHCSHEELGDGVTEAFRSDKTPPFPKMIGEMFSRSDPGERAGMLNQLLAALGPMAMSGGAASGLLGQLLAGRIAGAGGSGQSGQFPPQLTPEQAQQVSRDEVELVAAHAEREQPNLLDRVGHLYAQNPAMVKKLGGAALALILANVASRRGR